MVIETDSKVGTFCIDILLIVALAATRETIIKTMMQHNVHTLLAVSMVITIQQYDTKRIT